MNTPVTYEEYMRNPRAVLRHVEAEGPLWVLNSRGEKFMFMTCGTPDELPEYSNDHR